MSDTESSLSVGGLGVGGDTSASASSADEAHDLSDAGASEGDEGLPSGQSMFESSFLKGLSNLRLRKLARAHGIATNLQPRGSDLCHLICCSLRGCQLCDSLFRILGEWLCV